MGKLLNIITPLHKRAKRDYIGRMMDDKIYCMKKAKEYEFEYWDGDRRYGYGGYTYDGRWKIVAEKLIKQYKLKKNAKILDVGCGKGHLLFELHKLLPQASVVGFDISKHGIADAPQEIRPYLSIHKAQDKYKYKDKYFDLVISLNTLHNLEIFDLEKTLKEIQRVGKKGYITVEGFRNEAELFNLECWALTALSFYTDKAWIWLFKHFGYTGDYEFIYFE
jgi:ubiquinone/menaquinone biosynthesis C-methylase UbiE